MIGELKVGEGGAKEIESPKITVGFGAESAGGFGMGMAGKKDGKGGDGLDATGVGGGESVDRAIRAQVEVTI